MIPWSDRCVDVQADLLQVEPGSGFVVPVQSVPVRGLAWSLARKTVRVSYRSPLWGFPSFDELQTCGITRRQGWRAGRDASCCVEEGRPDRRSSHARYGGAIASASASRNGGIGPWAWALAACAVRPGGPWKIASECATARAIPSRAHTFRASGTAAMTLLVELFCARVSGIGSLHIKSPWRARTLAERRFWGTKNALQQRILQPPTNEVPSAALRRQVVFARAPPECSFTGRLSAMSPGRIALRPRIVLMIRHWPGRAAPARRSNVTCCRSTFSSCGRAASQRAAARWNCLAGLS